MEPPADSGPEREGGFSRRQFIRSLAAISAGLTVAAPLGRAAGGTTMIDLMKLEVMKPSRLVDLNPLQMRGIEMREDGLRIGALEKMSDVTVHPEVMANYPVISEALLKSASAQIRNMASIGGNLLQPDRRR